MIQMAAKETGYAYFRSRRDGYAIRSSVVAIPADAHGDSSPDANQAQPMATLRVSDIARQYMFKRIHGGNWLSGSSPGFVPELQAIPRHPRKTVYN
jgi:hypothetical protein